MTVTVKVPASIATAIRNRLLEQERLRKELELIVATFCEMDPGLAGLNIRLAGVTAGDELQVEVVT